jgi:hypothetical protein
VEKGENAMSPFLERGNRFLDRPLPLIPRAFLAASALLAGITAALLAGQAEAGGRTAAVVSGGFALLILRAAVHGRMSSLIDVLVLGAYLGLWAAWSAASDAFRPGPALRPLLLSAAGLLAATVAAWRASRVQAAEDLRTAGSS